MKKYIPITFSVIFSMCTAATASPVTWVKSPIVGIPNAGTFDTSSIGDTFVGDFRFIKQCGFTSIEVDCDLSFSVVISDTTGSTLDFDIAVFDFSSPGSCATILTPNSFSFSIPHDDLPTLNPLPAVQLFDDVLFSLPGFSVTSTCGSCAGPVQGTISNTDGLTLSLSGSLPQTSGSIPGDCQIEFQSSSASGSYLIWHQ